MAAPMALWVGVLVGSSYGVTKGWSSIWRELCKNATLPPDNHPKDGKKKFSGGKTSTGYLTFTYISYGRDPVQFPAPSHSFPRRGPCMALLASVVYTTLVLA